MYVSGQKVEKKVQIAIQKQKILKLKDEKDLEEVTIDLQREANVNSAD